VSWTPQSGIASYSLNKVERAAMECLRSGVSSSVGAALINAAYLDAADFFRSDVDVNDLLIDKAKLDR